MLESIMAGVAIAIGFLTLSSSFGALSFSIGLYIVLWMGYNLFTGKIGYARSKEAILVCLKYFIGNAIGCCIAFIKKLPNEIMIEKVNENIFISFIESVICGIIIFIAVQMYKEKHYFAPLLCVPAFILAGAEHCIADICFLFATRYFTIKSILFILLVTFGNSIGSLVVSHLYGKNRKVER